MLSTNFPLLIVACALYQIFHAKRAQWYYKNPVRRNFGPVPPGGAWAFIRLVAHMELDEFERHCGANARVMLELIRLAMRILLGYGAVALLEVLVYAIASLLVYPNGVRDGNGNDLGGLARCSFGNLHLRDVGQHTAAFYAATSVSVLGMYALTGLTLRQLQLSWTRVIDAAQRRMLDVSNHPAREAAVRTVLVLSGGEKGSNSSSMALSKMWRQIYPTAVHTVRVVRDTKRVTSLISKSFKLHAQIEKLEASLNVARSIMPSSDAYKAMSEQAQTKHEAKVEKLEALLDAKRAAHEAAVQAAEAEREAVDVPENDSGVCYFVSFRSRSAAAVARQVFNTAAVARVCDAPLPHEVNWPALYPKTAAASKLTATRLVTSAAYYSLLFLYSLPITFVSSLLVLEDLEADVAFIRIALCLVGPAIRNLIAAFLPTLALTLFLSLLPSFTRKLAAMQLLPDMAAVESSAILNLWVFNYVWVLLGAPVVNGLIGLANGGSSVEKIASQVSSMSTFFIIYLSVQSFFGMPFGSLSRVPKIVVESVLKRLGKLAPNLTKPEYVPYDVVWARTLLSVAVGIMYSTIAPVVIPFVLFHLGVSYLVLARGFLFSWSRGWLSGKQDGGKGLMWAPASKWLLIFLATAQLLLIGLHLIQLQVVTVVLLLPLPIATLRAHLHFARTCAPHLSLLPMSKCEAEDQAERESLEPLEPQGAMESADTDALANKLALIFGDAATADTYVQPEMRLSTWERLRMCQAAPPVPGDFQEPPPCFRVAVLGASGGIGHHCVRLALESGHTVVALAREPAEIEPRRHRRVHKFGFDVATGNATELASLIKGCHFVVSCLGNRKGEGQIVHSGTAMLLSAMTHAGVPRMAMVSCIGVGSSAKQLKSHGPMGWLVAIMFQTVLKRDMDDLAAAETECLTLPKRSGLTAVVVRAADLSDRDGTGDFLVTTAEGSVGTSVAREDVARFMLSLVHNQEHDRMTVSIGGPVLNGKAALEAAPARRPSSTSTQLVIAAPVLSPAQAETQVVRVNDDHDAKRVEEAKARAVELEQRIQDLEAQVHVREQTIRDLEALA